MLELMTIPFEAATYN